MQVLRVQGSTPCVLDDEDYERWRRYEWGADESGYVSAYFAIGGGRTVKIRLHRLIAHPLPGQHVHHRNRKVFDNRRENLQCVSAALHASLHPGSSLLRRWALSAKTQPYQRTCAIENLIRTAG